MWSLFYPELRFGRDIAGGSAVFLYWLTGLPMWLVPVVLLAASVWLIFKVLS